MALLGSKWLQVLALAPVLVGSAASLGCTMDFAQYTPGCGDGVLDRSIGEECDDGNIADGDACSSQCRVTSFTVQDNVGGEEISHLLRPAAGLIGAPGDTPQFVLSWVHAQDQSQGQVQTKRYYPNGTAVPLPDGEVTLSTDSTGVECTSIAGSTQGRAVVAWNAVEGAEHKTRWSVLEPNGKPWDAEPQSVTGTGPPVFFGCPEVAATQTGEYCIIWHDAALDAMLECLDSEGQSTGTPVDLGPAGDFPTGRFNGARGIFGTSNGFGATWYAQAADPPLLGAQLDASGAVQGSTVTISASKPVYAGNGFGWGDNDAFVASFGVSHDVQGTSKWRFMFRRYDNITSPADNEVLVSTTQENEPGGRIIGSPTGRFLAVWPSSGGSAGCQLHGRRFDPSGQAQEDPFPIGDLAAGECAEGIEGVANSSGDVMLVWEVVSQSGAGGQAKVRAAVYPGMLAP